VKISGVDNYFASDDQLHEKKKCIDAIYFPAKFLCSSACRQSFFNIADSFFGQDRQQYQVYQVQRAIVKNQ
jgi:hypothetical protein